MGWQTYLFLSRRARRTGGMGGLFWLCLSGVFLASVTEFSEGGQGWEWKL